jgi:hypothetical protein
MLCKYIMWFLFMETYYIQTEISYDHRANKLIKFIKESKKKLSDVLLILLHLYVKFQDQNDKRRKKQ